MSPENTAALPILIVDDERSMREFLSLLLKKEGHSVEVAASGDDALVALAEGRRFKLVITDLKMPGSTSGLEVLKKSKEVNPVAEVILMTAFASAETAISAIKHGAYDYITKPFKVDEVKIAVHRALEKFTLVDENRQLKEVIETRQGYGDLIGESPAMQRVYSLIDRVAPTKTTILIYGESGTGKELVARALHRRSSNSEGPFLPINCGAIPENLIESELFGHQKGAFTGATADKEGLFIAAKKGTVFLDEIGELPHQVQVKLLRVLQEGKVRSVGATGEREIQCRIVAATNRDLKKEVEAGNFREDLYYRLSIIPIELPPLRERGDDVDLLLRHFLRHYAREIGNPIEGFAEETLEVLKNHRYPGNVRELQNIMERAVTLEMEPLIQVASLPPGLSTSAPTSLGASIPITDQGIDLEALVSELERNLIQKTLEFTEGNKTDAAALLGISFRSFRYRLEKYDL